MKRLWNACKIAFAMFSKIPTPQADWSEENMEYMFCFFPLIGVVIGVLTEVWWYVSGLLGMVPLFRAVFLVLIPLFVTGGIHMDGFLDTADAMSSWQSRERRLEILKDSNSGAFAVIHAGMFYLCYLAGYMQILEDPKAVFVMACIFAYTRCFTGICVVTLPKAKKEGTVAEFAKKSSDRTVRNVLTVYILLITAGLLGFQPWYGLTVCISTTLTCLLQRRKMLKYFGGITGDLAGSFSCINEVTAVLALSVVSCVLRLF